VHDLICDVISYQCLNSGIDNIGVNDKILIKNLKMKKWDPIF